MQQFAGKTVFITGGASGIGFALARAFSDVGMNIMLADIESDTLAAATQELKQSGANVRGVRCDVADPSSVDQAAEATYAAFGNVHILCNNAGVAGAHGIDNISLESWRWVIDVNLMGVVHGIRTFLPHLRAHGEGGHIVNTASMAGLQSKGGFSAYQATKYAVVSMSEGLAVNLKSDNIGVSVLCPSFVNTHIGKSGRNRQERYGAFVTPDPESPAGKRSARVADLLRDGRDPSYIAACTLDAIRENELYILTHPEWNWEVEERVAAIQVAMEKATARSR